MVYITGVMNAPRDNCPAGCAEECKRMYGPNGESGFGNTQQCFMLVACTGELNSYNLHEFALCAQRAAYNPEIFCEMPCKFLVQHGIFVF